MRLRRNCTLESDFLAQANNMGHRFIEKGYDSQYVKERISEVAEMNHNELIKDKKKQEMTLDIVPIILDYNIQYRKIERIIKRHWHILLTDRHLKDVLHGNPKFIYKRAPTIHDRIVKSILDPPKIGLTFYTGKGFFPLQMLFCM